MTIQIDDLVPVVDQLARAEELIEELVAENEALRQALRGADGRYAAA